MTKTRLLTLALVVVPFFAMAQKKELAEARNNVKHGTNLENAENAMRTLLKDSANLENEKIWLTLFESIKKQYEQLNEKLYLKQQSDTAKLFSHTIHMFDVLESLDSVDMKPDKNGRVQPVYRKNHASYLHQYRGNLYNGGVYFMKKQNYAEAYRYFDTYIECAQQPLFSSYDYSTTDKHMTDAAYWSVFCGYKLSQPALIDRYVDLAMQEPSREAYLLQYMSESCKIKNDTACYHRILREGFAKYPTNPYFFPYLASYLGLQGNHLEVKVIAEKLLEHDGNNTAALLALSSSLLYLEQYDECVEVADRLLTLDDSVSRAYLNAGLSYYNKSLPLAEKKKPTKVEREQLLTLYRRSLPYLQKYREMMPDESALWAKPLYNIYLNLNMGDEFEEIEEIMLR